LLLRRLHPWMGRAQPSLLPITKPFKGRLFVLIGEVPDLGMNKMLRNFR